MTLRFDGVHKFGKNASVADSYEPIVDENAAANAFPAAEATTTVLSSSVEDDTDKGAETPGTGAFTVNIMGIGDAGEYISETVTMNGTAAVSCTNDYRIILRAYVASAGTGKTNAGRIDIKHGATVIACIAIGEGQSQILAWYFNDGGQGGKVANIEMHVASISTVTCDFRMILERNGVKRVQHVGELTSDNPTENRSFGTPILYQAGDLVYVEAKVSTGTKVVDGSFDVINF